MPRHLHPGAWWLWALGLATAASRTTNPLLLALVVAVAGVVVANRRTDAPWALGFRFYLILAAVVVVSRVVFRIVFGGGVGEHIAFRLPEIPLPGAAAGIRLLGPVAVEQLLAAFYDGMRLAAMLVCLGAANALANPRRMMRAVPGALAEVGTAVVVALSVAPQLIDSVVRVRRARRLRGGRTRGLPALRGIAMPVLVDALDRSLLLAASMDSRGYGRTAGVPRTTRTVTAALVLGGLLGVCVGLYGVLDATTPGFLGIPVLLGGAGLAVAGLALGGRRVRRTRYRPDRWRAAEVAVAGTGVLAAAVLASTYPVDPTGLYPPLTPLVAPHLPVLATAAVLVAALPAWLAPRPPAAHPDVSGSHPPTPIRTADQVPG